MIYHYMIVESKTNVWTDVKNSKNYINQTIDKSVHSDYFEIKHTNKK